MDNTLTEIIRRRRSIRKYSGQPVERRLLEQVVEAGLYAPNAGGGQRTYIVGLLDPELIAALGRLNVAHLDRSRLVGSYVSADQPSIIDDPTLPSGFYGAPALAVVFAPERFLYSIPDAFCCAENMVLQATELDLASCMVARAEETFANPFGQELMRQWNVPEGYVARCFVLLGHCQGDYPKAKPRHENRMLIVQP